jgi:type II secretory pathway component GspD/PulD (secretin)
MVSAALLILAAFSVAAAEEAPRPKEKKKPDAARLERRLAKLEAQQARLAKEIQGLREQLGKQQAEEEKLVFYLKYVKADDIAQVLRAVYAVKGKAEIIQVVPDVRLNALVVRGSKAKLDEVKQLIEQLDREEREADAAPALKVVPLKSGR